MGAAMSNRLHGAGRYAVGAIRKSKTNTLDDFPTPPWATRATCEHVIKPSGTVLEPAANRGFMVRPLTEYFDSVTASDIADYGCGYPITDFLGDYYRDSSFDWVISNPPFNQAAAFIIRANQVARIGVAMLCKIQILESVKRYEGVYQNNPPSIVAQFVERVPMKQGRYDPKGSTATAYAWLVWGKQPGITRVIWIPPCRKKLERPGDAD